MGYRKNGRRRGAAESRLVSEATPDVLADVFFGSEDGASSSPRAAGNDGDQLCAQVADALTLALAGADNPWLRDLVVVRVTPRRGSACLELVLEAPRDHDLVRTTSLVNRAVGWLRTEIGDAIERKRVPELVVVVVPETPPEVSAEEVSR